ncbi:restriction endonuclease [Lottiidibacillus patelloidae]|uniref:Restriction endonuclease n=1 Tax=Lottiidibacillus patelloidae TaxID=2670334 RepID=A0A263BYJ3_9BACI|nr:restriction endonuclease [Lottiidibacillus patelloidae]OZM58357.1 restriction endonuclease [Lottiidibacillus patelloidae]
MSIPDYQAIMYPLLEHIRDGKEYSNSDLMNCLADHFKLSDDELKQMLPSGTKVFKNRVHWAKTYLKKAMLIEAPRKGYACISERGLAVVADPSTTKITNKYLKQFDEFKEFINPNKKETSNDENSTNETETPEEVIANTYQELKDTLADELISTIKTCSPEFFERLVVELLVKMGYGGSLVDAGQAVGKSGDGGIDGIIKEDQLGLDIIYLQAKRWENVVGSPEIQKFAGALQGQRAKKGVFITTSHFTKDALAFVRKIDSNIVLIDGKQLAHLMIDNQLGVSTIDTIEIKKIDTDYFVE